MLVFKFEFEIYFVFGPVLTLSAYCRALIGSFSDANSVFDAVRGLGDKEALMHAGNVTTLFNLATLYERVHMTTEAVEIYKVQSAE